MASHELVATDVVVAAGPWTPKIFPSVQLGAPRGHSVVVRPSRKLSSYVLFPEIQPPADGTLPGIVAPEIHPRPGDGLYAFDTVYACGPDDYTVPLPEDTNHVQVDQKKTEDVWMAIKRYAESFPQLPVFPLKGEVLFPIFMESHCSSTFVLLGFRWPQSWDVKTTNLEQTPGAMQSKPTPKTLSSSLLRFSRNLSLKLLVKTPENRQSPQ